MQSIYMPKPMKERFNTNTYTKCDIDFIVDTYGIDVFRDYISKANTSKKSYPVRKGYITASYKLHSVFKVPDYLLEPEENDNAPGDTVGSWYIKYDTLEYVNKDGEDVEIEPVINAEMTHDYHRPDEEHFNEHMGLIGCYD